MPITIGNSVGLDGTNNSADVNDTVLISEGLWRHSDGHENHAHFEIKPPVRE